MDYFPAFLQLDARPCLLVGGGDIALRKARLLLAAGARLTIVSPEMSATLHKLVADDQRISWQQREFRDADVAGHWLVVSASGKPAVERRVAASAETHGVFCNAVDDLENCSYITPAIIDRSPLVVAVSTGGRAPVLARRVRAQIESLLSPRIAVLGKLLGRWRERVAARIEDAPGRLRFWEQAVDGAVADAVLAGHDAIAEKLIADLLVPGELRAKEQGIAWLVGAGPGDPGLLTMRAFQTLQSADVILHDRLVSMDILQLARRDATMISVGKTPGCMANSQDEINALLTRLVAEGKRVCRLKGGDPFIFGRGGEEAAVLASEGLRYEVVPGITSAAGCAASAGIPLTHRDMAQSLLLLTAHGKDSIDTLDWESLARARQTLAVYMGVRRFPVLMQKLIEHGRAATTPIAIIERGTTPQQRVLRGTLGQLTLLADANRVEAPAMLLIGEVAKLGSEIAGAAAQNDHLPEAHRALRPHAEVSARPAATIS